MDDDELRRHLAGALRQEGFPVKEAADGKEALLLVAEHPDLVILDVHDQRADNLDICRAIKAHAAATSTPVLHWLPPEEALAVLVRRMMHECNNLLQAITGNVDLLLRQCAGSEPAHEVLAAVGHAAWRAVDITQCLLGCAPAGVPTALRLDCGQALRHTHTLLRPLLDERYEVAVCVAPDVWPVEADPGQVSRILMNLCLNARDAMPDGGRLTLEAVNVGFREPPPGWRGGVKAGGFVRLRVADSGRGIPPDVLPLLFDPFFTTKGQGPGFGLGLAVVRDFVEQHQGWIECSSAPGGDTQFDMYLPRAAAECSLHHEVGLV